MATSRPTRPLSGVDVRPDARPPAYEPRPARGWDDAAAVVIDGAWGTPPARDVRQMRNVTPGAPPDSGVGASRVCAAGFSPCMFADTPSHFHSEGRRKTIFSPACSSCGTVFGPFDGVGRCGRCAAAGAAPAIGAGKRDPRP